MQAREQTYFGESDSFVTVRHLTIRGTNYQIGHKLAELAIERYHRSPCMTSKPEPSSSAFTSAKRRTPTAHAPSAAVST